MTLEAEHRGHDHTLLPKVHMNKWSPNTVVYEMEMTIRNTTTLLSFIIVMIFGPSEQRIRTNDVRLEDTQEL